MVRAPVYGVVPEVTTASELEKRFLDGAPVLFDVVSSDMTILYANSTETKTLGMVPGSLVGVRADTVYVPASIEIIRWHLLQAQSGAQTHVESARLAMTTASKRQVEFAASLDVAVDPEAGFVVRIAKLPSGSVLDRLETLESENEVLTGIIATARDATYCIDFDEPVDLRAPDHEVIRQVFENACRWRYCNEAMARFYRLPPGEDLNSRDVHEVFPRNPENEAFIRELIAHGWHLNAAPSRDHRYDGAEMVVDNDVRSKIIDGRLHRFWGIVRDQSSRILKERQLRTEANLALDLLGAVPDPILVVNRDGRIEGANPAVEWALGWSLDEILGNRLSAVVQLRANLRALFDSAGTKVGGVRQTAMAICDNGALLTCDLNIGQIASEGVPSRLVVAMRMPSQAQRPSSLSIAEGGA